MLVSNGTGYPAMQTIVRVVAHYADGTDDDVTADATLTPNDMTIAISGATATATAAGEYTITAMVDRPIRDATLDVELVGDSVGSGVNQAGLDGTPDRRNADDRVSARRRVVPDQRRAARGPRAEERSVAIDRARDIHVGLEPVVLRSTRPAGVAEPDSSRTRAS